MIYSVKKAVKHIKIRHKRRIYTTHNKNENKTKNQETKEKKSSWAHGKHIATIRLERKST